MSRSTAQPEHPPKVTDLLIRQKCEAMIEYGYVALRQFPKFERHVLASLSSLWWGVSVSNLIVLLTAATPVGLATGAMVGLALWQGTALEREFAAICARERLSNPRLRCVFTPTT